jgi:transporter family-2 protein
VNVLWLPALLAGMVLPLQAVINGRLSKEVGSPVLASFVSFLVGTVCLGLDGLATRVALPSASSLGRLPAWIWLGGLVGTVYMVGVVSLVPRLGVSVTMGLVITGQIILSAFLDHFGLLGLHTHPLNAGRVLGMVLLIAGVILVKRF